MRFVFIFLARDLKAVGPIAKLGEEQGYDLIAIGDSPSLGIWNRSDSRQSGAGAGRGNRPGGRNCRLRAARESHNQAHSTSGD